MPTSPKARKIVKAVNGQIITLSEDSLKAVDDIGQYHHPKKVQSVTFGGTNIKLNSLFNMLSQTATSHAVLF